MKPEYRRRDLISAYLNCQAVPTMVVSYLLNNAETV